MALFRSSANFKLIKINNKFIRKLDENDVPYNALLDPTTGQVLLDPTTNQILLAA